MHTLRQIFNRQKKALFFLLALFVIGWAFTEFRPVFGGLILGSLFGLYNFWILVRRMDRFNQSVSEGKETKAIGGTALRFGSGVAAAAIALSMPEDFNLISTVIGLMIPYILLLIDRIVVHVKHF
ncbi:ATP synthase subunit I [Sporosarcina highlanderae]|uniref:ATP synthase subunit I n=1 Tax=Sporosarcina highlanderae TaxID=3035916 RepID=A0ABT8JP94_9BACL|nr:ATP synthase subunit I [Sporosarcina highlanderae]MDN4605999.1 ATP synthase subunit I [Sporosarcina highlanderae]